MNKNGKLCLCKQHEQEENHSHFDPCNCDYCKLLSVAKILKTACEMIGTLHGDTSAGYAEARIAIKQAGEAGI